MSTDAASLIQVVIPTRNRLKHLNELLKSLERYSAVVLEVIIINNGCELLESSINYNHPFTIFNVPPTNLSDIFTRCLDCVSTEHFLLCADDIYDLEGISDAIEFISSHQDVAVVTGPIVSETITSSTLLPLYLSWSKSMPLLFRWLNELLYDGQVFAPGHYSRFGFWSSGAEMEGQSRVVDICVDLATSSWMLGSSKLIRACGGFSSKYKFNHVDGDLFLRLQDAGFKICYRGGFRCVHKVLKGESRELYYLGRDSAVFLTSCYKYKIGPFKFAVIRSISVIYFSLGVLFSVLRSTSDKKIRKMGTFIKGVCSGLIFRMK